MSRPWQENTGLLALRAGVGGVLVAHGVQKLFGWLGGRGLKDTGATFEQLGFTPGLPSAVAAGMGEAGGGVLIMVGLATPAAGAAAVGTMIPAAAVLAPSGFFATRGGYEYPALLGVSAAALALTGPGDWSLDACLGYRLNPPWAAPAALLAFSAASLVILQRRRKLLAARSATDPSQIGDDDAATPARRSGSDPPAPGSQG